MCHCPENANSEKQAYNHYVYEINAKAIVAYEVDNVACKAVFCFEILQKVVCSYGLNKAV